MTKKPLLRKLDTVIILATTVALAFLLATVS